MFDFGNGGFIGQAKKRGIGQALRDGIIPNFGDGGAVGLMSRGDMGGLRDSVIPKFDGGAIGGMPLDEPEARRRALFEAIRQMTGMGFRK